MAQTLKPWAANSITEPVTVTQSEVLAANVAAIQNLSNREVLALAVLGAIYELQAKGGYDYRTNHKQLRIDSAAFMGAFSAISIPNGGELTNRIMAVIAWNAAYQASNAIGTDVNALVLNMAGLRETPEATLTWEYYYLLYQLAI